MEMSLTGEGGRHGLIDSASGAGKDAWKQDGKTEDYWVLQHS